MTTERAEAFRAQLGRRLADVQATLATIDGARWQRPCEAEGWTVGLVARHIAWGLARQAGWIEDRAAGKGPHHFSWDDTNELNAVNSRRDPGTRDEVAAAIGTEGARLMDLAARMDDAALDAVTFVYKERPRGVDAVFAIVLRHIDDHLESIRKTAQ